MMVPSLVRGVYAPVQKIMLIPLNSWFSQLTIIMKQLNYLNILFDIINE